MYTDNEIEQLREKIKIIQEIKENTINEMELQKLNEKEKEISVFLISKYYRMVNYSHFDAVNLVTALSKLISIIEDKNMTPDIVFVAQKIGHGNITVHYAKLIIRKENDQIPVYYEDKTQFEEEMNNKDILVISEEVGSISKEMDVFSLVTDSLFINQDNMNLENIKGVKFAIHLGDRQYLKDYIISLISYKHEHEKMDISATEMTNIMNDYIHNYKQEKRLLKEKSIEAS